MAPRGRRWKPLQGAYEPPRFASSYDNYSTESRYAPEPIPAAPLPPKGPPYVPTLLEAHESLKNQIDKEVYDSYRNLRGVKLAEAAISFDLHLEPERLYQSVRDGVPLPAGAKRDGFLPGEKEVIGLKLELSCLRDELTKVQDELAQANKYIAAADHEVAELSTERRTLLEEQKALHSLVARHRQRRAPLAAVDAPGVQVAPRLRRHMPPSQLKVSFDDDIKVVLPPTKASTQPTPSSSTSAAHSKPVKVVNSSASGVRFDIPTTPGSVGANQARARAHRVGDGNAAVGHGVRFNVPPMVNPTPGGAQGIDPAVHNVPNGRDSNRPSLGPCYYPNERSGVIRGIIQHPPTFSGLSHESFIANQYDHRPSLRNPIAAASTKRGWSAGHNRPVPNLSQLEVPLQSTLVHSTTSKHANPTSTASPPSPGASPVSTPQAEPVRILEDANHTTANEKNNNTGTTAGDKSDKSKHASSSSHANGQSPLQPIVGDRANTQQASSTERRALDTHHLSPKPAATANQGKHESASVHECAATSPTEHRRAPLSYASMAAVHKHLQSNNRGKQKPARGRGRGGRNRTQATETTGLPESSGAVQTSA